jgi:hypothetical protein
VERECAVAAPAFKDEEEGPGDLIDSDEEDIDHTEPPFAKKVDHRRFLRLMQSIRNMSRTDIDLWI